MIRPGDNPDGDPNLVKFIGSRGDGFRGDLVATAPDGRSAVVRTLDETSGGAPKGSFVLIAELEGDTHYAIEIPGYWAAAEGAMSVLGVLRANDWTLYPPPLPPGPRGPLQ